MGCAFGKVVCLKFPRIVKLEENCFLRTSDSESLRLFTQGVVMAARTQCMRNACRVLPMRQPVGPHSSPERQAGYHPHGTGEETEAPQAQSPAQLQQKKGIEPGPKPRPSDPKAWTPLACNSRLPSTSPLASNLSQHFTGSGSHWPSCAPIFISSCDSSLPSHVTTTL